MIAALRPRLVRSLTLLEPPAFQLLPNDPDAVATSTRIYSAIATVYDDPDSFFAAYMSSAFGDTSMREQVAWDAALNLGAIADAHIPTLVVCGDWDPGFVAVSRHLGTALSARVIEYAESSHFFDERWNDIAGELARLWRAVDAQ